MTDGGAADRALDAVAVAVAASLAGSGWRRRSLGVWWLDTFTREVAGGVIGTVEVQRLAVASGAEWPADVRVHLGVGYEPALGLMPLLGLTPVATLVNRATRGVTVHDDGEVARAAHEIAGFVDERAATVAAGFPVADSVVQALRVAADVVDEDWQQRRRERHLMMLAAVGRVEEAAAPLELYREEHSAGFDGERARRFARQLSRRLMAMPSPVPPVEETLAMLPARPVRAPRPAEGTVTDERAQREAFESVRAQAHGKSLPELRLLIADEFEQRGLAMPPSSAATMAETLAAMVAAERSPIGRARLLAGALWMMGSVVGGLWRTVTHGIQAAPDWMRPPERAAYPVPTSHDAYIAVIVDRAARDWLERIRSQRPRPGFAIGPGTRVEVWLTRPDPADHTVTAYIGDRPVGTLSARDGDLFASFFDAAALLDEDPVLPGHLTHTADGIDILEIPRPDPARIDDDVTADYLVPDTQ